MKTSVFYGVCLAFLVLMFPLAAKAFSSSADTVHFCKSIDPDEWEREQTFPPAGKRTALNAGESRIVRLFYFLPNDRPFRASVVEAMKAGILEVQSFYREQMEAHGHGSKTFQIETDAQGAPIVHRVNGDHSDSHYKTRGRPENEISRAFDTSSIVQLIVMDISRSSGGIGVGVKQSGMGIVYGGWSWSTAAHELGHGFGLQHDFRDDAYIMSYGNNQNSLSACAARFLAVNPYFNQSVPLAAGSAPTVELTSSTDYSYGATSVPVHLRVRDADGLQQVSLFVRTPEGAGFGIPSGFMEVVACHDLSGQGDETITFNFDGDIPSIAGDVTVLNQLRHTIFVSAVDRQGNRIEPASTGGYTLKAINIPALRIPLRDRSPRVAESIYEIVRRFHDRSVSSHDHITDAHLAKITNMNVLRIHASDSPLQSSDFDGLSNLEKLELRLDAGFSEESLLPAGIFKGLNSLNSLQIKYYVGIYGEDPSLFPLLPFPVGLRKVGEGKFKAVVHTGAPFDMDLPLIVVNGTINGGEGSISIPSGRVESDILTVTRTPGTTAAVVVDLERTVPSPPNSGYVFYKSSVHLEMFKPLAGALTPVPERTSQVIDAIVGAVPGINHVHHDRALRYMMNGRFMDRTYDMSHYVSEAQLAAITSLDVSGGGNPFDFGGNWFSRHGDITELKPGDFDGLTSLTELELDDNQLSSLPENIFDQLTNLTKLFLDGNQLSALPEGVFDQLTNLTRLALSNNQLGTLPDGVFDKLTSLTVLTLNSNQLSTLADGLFDPLTNLTRLYLNSNQLSVLPDGLFDQLTDLTLLNLFDNPVSSVQESDFDHLTNLEVLILPGGPVSNPLPEFSGDTPVTDRTPQVRDAIVAAAGANSAGDVTETHLAAITELDLSGKKVTALKTGDFDNLTALQALGLHENQLRSLPGDIFEYLVNLEGLALQDNQLNSLPKGLFDNNTALKSLGLHENRLSSIPEGLFDNNTRMRIIYLNDNELSALPQGLFDSPANLLFLDLSGNQLSSIPEGLFGRVTLVLLLNDNQLSSLPEGFFTGIFHEIPDFTGFTLFGNPLGPIPEDTYKELRNPTTLDLTNNPGAPYSFTVSLEKVGHGQFKAIVPTGAPFDIPLPLTVTNGSISTGADTLTIPAGRLQSDTLTVTRIPGTTFAVTANFRELPGMPKNHRGYALLKSADLPLVFTEFGGMISVCDRTPQVRDVIAAAAPVATCTTVTEAHLASISRLDLVNDRISTLRRGDFSGLTNLTLLSLNNNQLSSLPADLFDSLTNLSRLSLNSNQLSSLPSGVFDNLTHLTTLALNRNQLASLPSGVFDHLPNLISLDLRGNQLTSLPTGLFDNLRNLVGLYLNTNRLSSLPAGLFNHLTSLGELDLARNQLNTLPKGIFDNLTNPVALVLSQNQLRSLPAELFSNLTPGVDLSGNQLSSLPESLFVNLANLSGGLDLTDNLIDPLPLTVSLERFEDDQFKAVTPTGAPFELVLPVNVSGPGAIAGGATTITIPIGSVESAPLAVARTPGTTDAVHVDIGTLPGLPKGHSGYALVKSADLPLAYHVGAEGRSGETPGEQATTDFNGDGRTDFVDFFLFIDAYGGTDFRFDLDGSGSVDFVDFFQFVDAFDQPGQAKLLALAQELIGLPSESELQQNRPNPFNSETVISWVLLRPGPARVEMFALTGQRVAVLHQGPKKAGVHRVHWDGRDSEGRPLASGVYLYRLVTSNAVLTRKLTLLR